MVLEWYPWENFSDIEEVGKGGYATVFRAKVKLERIRYWNHQTNQWSREDIDEYNEYVALKTIGHCESLSKDFMNEVINLYLLY